MSSRSGMTHKCYPVCTGGAVMFGRLGMFRSSALAEVKAQLREACGPACPEEQQPAASGTLISSNPRGGPFE